MAKRGRPRHPDILTPREWEVLALVREGLSNEQIAERLEITERTARFHVSEILGKLGVSTRREAAAWQPEQRRPWWAIAIAPLSFGRAHRWLATAVGGVTLVVAVVGVVLFSWGLMRTNGDPSAALSSETPTSGSLSVEEARQFQDFPAYWIGESFQDLPLEHIARYVWIDPNRYGGLDASQDNLSLVYGSCRVPAGVEGCAVPLVVESRPYCKVPPNIIADRVKDGDFFEFRGATALWTLGGTGLTLWTGEVSVNVSSPRGKTFVQAAATQLVSLNVGTTESPADDLPPDAVLSCPPNPVLS